MHAKTLLPFLDPWHNLLLVNAFVDTFISSFREAYSLANPVTGGAVTTASIHCPCGNTWTYRRPDHYGGSAMYPQKCPACGGSGQRQKKLSSAV